MTPIPVHRLQEETSLGLWVRHFELSGTTEKALGVHRDDHYIFAVQEKGACRMTVDFKEISTSGSALFYVLPGQVHHGVITQDITCWFIAVDTALIEDEYRKVFETYMLHQSPLTLSQQQLSDIKACLQLLYNRYQQSPDSLFYRPVIHSLVTSFTGMVAAAYLEKEPGNEQAGSRPLAITRQFRALLLQRYLTLKSPAAYAEAMHLSLSYLNECVKAVTGFSVTYWIQYEIILEAKRLLYYTEMSVKEIAFALGYEDHTYFSRLFTKAAGMPAGRFRRLYRE